MIANSWQKISYIGIKKGYDDKLVKRIMLTNQFCLVALVVFVFGGINNFIIGDTFSAILIEVFALICLSGFLLNKLGHHKFTTSFLLVSISCAIFYFDSYSGLNSGTYLYHFPLILAIAFIFDPKEKTAILLHFLLPLTLLVVNVLTKYELFRSAFLTDEDRYHMFMFNLPFSASSIGLFIYLTISNNIRQSELYELRINERKESERIIKQALAEKEILLAEIHHRVKNNLAIIAGLFNLQLSAVENKEAKEILIDSKNRVQSMALIHDRLYKNDNMSDVDFGTYIDELIREIAFSYPALSSNIIIHKNISNVKLNVNNAIPCGLIINELLSNCYKHAFKDREKGMIAIDFNQQGSSFFMKVQDDGVGLKHDYEKSDSLGMVVILSLSEQLNGKYEFSVNNGTCFELSFEQKSV